MKVLVEKNVIEKNCGIKFYLEKNQYKKINIKILLENFT